MALNERHDVGPDGNGGDVDDKEVDDVDRNPVSYLGDVQAESGDEAELTDIYRLDSVEAVQMGVALDSAGGQEALLD